MAHYHPQNGDRLPDSDMGVRVYVDECQAGGRVVTRFEFLQSLIEAHHAKSRVNIEEHDRQAGGAVAAVWQEGWMDVCRKLDEARRRKPSHEVERVQPGASGFCGLHYVEVLRNDFRPGMEAVRLLDAEHQADVVWALGPRRAFF